MKLVYLFNSSVPSYNASSLQVVNVCQQISKDIGNITLITPDTGLKKTLYNHYGFRKNFEIIKIKFFKSFPKGINYYLFSIYSIVCSFKLKPEIYITRNYFTLFLLIILKKKVIFEVHSSLDIEGRINNFIFNNFKLFNSKYIVNLIFITKSLQNFFYEKYKIKRKNFCILPSASNLRSNFPIFKKNKKLKIGYFGLVNKSRGLEFICDLSKVDSENEYFIFGGSKDLINSVKKKSFNKNIFLNEYLPYKKIKKLMQEMDLLILPYEKKVLVSGNVGDIGKFTSPMKVFDYLGSTKPIIASSLPVLEEILTDQKNCIFVNGLNIYRWRLEIKKFSNNPSLRQIISKNNFLLSKNFTYGKRIRKMFDFK